MRVYEAILVPTDGSSTAQRAVHHAIERARSDEAELHAVTILDTGSERVQAVTRAWDEDAVADELRDRAREDLGKVIEPASEADLEVHTAVREHDGVAESILAHADEHGIDLIVMGTHGRSGLERIMLGSVAEGVLRKAHRPVLAGPPTGVDGQRHP